MDNASQIVTLGRLTTKQWRGSVSAATDAADSADIVATLDSYYVPTHPHAKERCIDGRHDPQLDEQSLGPQVPGGAAGGALAYRLGVDKDDLTRGTFYSDFESIFEMYLRLGIAPGGHRDNAARESGTGCGAIDAVETVLACLLDNQLVDDNKRLTRALLDSEFDRDNFLRNLGAGLVLSSNSSDYFAGREQCLSLLDARAPGSVSVLEGTHNEKFVIVNLVPGTTLASNRFAAEHDGRQAFGYDLWRSREIAQQLLPHESQALDRQRFVTARVMLTIATLMALTDGTQQLLVRLPVAVDESE